MYYHPNIIKNKSLKIRIIMSKRIYFLLVIHLAFLLCLNTHSSACTTAIISGKGTPDGRSLLFKHRDSGFEQNRLMYFTDGTYPFIGLVNSEDMIGKEVWAGANSAGFAIMNSASYNLNTSDTTLLKDQEGIIMKEALRSCATLKDFEELLRTWPKPMGVEANFGVIDADGGAAYYETTNFSFIKIDANDPVLAPFGYLIRTNYSFSGTDDDGYGYIRYLTAEELFYQAAAENKLTYQFLLQDVSRSLKHSLLNVDLEVLPLLPAKKDHFIGFQDYIPRNSSVTTMVVQGIKKEESPDFTTIWTLLGFPLCSVVIPTWAAGGDKLPKMLISDDSGNAPLCQRSLELKKKCFPINRGSGYKYINLSALLNAEGEGIMQKLLPVEQSVIQLTETNLNRWRREGMSKTEIQSFYKQVSQLLYQQDQILPGL